MANIVLICFYFFLPAYFANMAPVFVKNKFNFLKIPLDFGIKVSGNELFGSHKTLRGIIFGVIFSIVVVYIQYLLYVNNILFEFALIDYSKWLLFGFLMGFGAIFGDLIESFVKRRIGLKSGKSLVPFDQLDFVVGALIFTYPLVKLSFEKVLVILLFSFIMHMVINHIAYYSGFRKEKW